MAAHLPAGGRLVNYDPQTYASYPGSPQGHPGPEHHSAAAFRVGLRIDRQRQLRGRHPHPRAGRPGPRAALLGSARPAQPARSRQRARVLLGPAADRARLDRLHHPGQGEPRHRPRPAPRLRRRLQRHRLPLLPRGPSRVVRGPLASRGTSESPWDRPRPQSCSASRRARARRSVSECSPPTARPDGDARSRVPPGANQASMALPAGSWVGLSLQVLDGSIPSHRVVVTAEGAPYELGGSLSSALTARSVAGGRLLAGIRGLHVRATLHAHLGASPPRGVRFRCGCSRAAPSPRRSGCGHRRHRS